MFDGKNFCILEYAYQGDHLYSKQVHHPFPNEKLVRMLDDDWKLFDRQALSVIRLRLKKNVGHNLPTQKTTFDLMKELSDMLRSYLHVQGIFDEEII